MCEHEKRAHAVHTIVRIHSVDICTICMRNVHVRGVCTQALRIYLSIFVVHIISEITVHLRGIHAASAERRFADNMCTVNATNTIGVNHPNQPNRPDVSQHTKISRRDERTRYADKVRNIYSRQKVDKKGFIIFEFFFYR